ncbi:MAG: inositol monophosphatase [Sedimentisphaerales bacterium]|nr:inositol monophosphatase [Sedimentisphaerales bacterium]
MLDLQTTQCFLHDMILQAGHIAVEYRKKLETLHIRRKAMRDDVTEADVAVEQFIIEQIRHQFPNHAVYGEESGQTAGNEYRWVIDPIDGTTSFLHGQPFYSISIGLEYRGNAVLGAVYQPSMNELFEAFQDGPATLNGQVIAVSQQEDLSECVMGTGFACLRLADACINLNCLNYILPQIRDIRRCGSAAMDLCYVACGRFDGFWEFNLNPYDISAGVLIAERAGARVSDMRGTRDGLPKQILCTNGRVHSDMLALFEAVLERQ